MNQMKAGAATRIRQGLLPNKEYHQEQRQVLHNGKRSAYQNNIIILNVYALNRYSKLFMQRLKDTERETEKSTTQPVGLDSFSSN